MYRVKSGGEVELRREGEAIDQGATTSRKRGGREGGDVCHLSACRNSRSGSPVSEGSARGRADGPHVREEAERWVGIQEGTGKAREGKRVRKGKEKAVKGMAKSPRVILLS